MEAMSLSEIIKEVIDYRGKTPKKLNADWSKSGYRALSAKNIKNGKIVQLETIRYVDENLYKKWMKQEIEEGTIIITSEAPFGEVFYWNSDEKIVLSQRLFGLKVKDNFNSKYIYYYMTSSNFQNELRGRATGTTVIGLRQPELLKCKINIPSKENQDKIDFILSIIDKKIELNNQINNNLLEINKQLYKRWFIDFEFPNEDGKPYKSSGGRMVESKLGEIPENWNCKYLEELVDIINGYSYKGKELVEESNIGMVTIKNFDRTGGFKLDGYKPLNPEKIKEQQIVELFDLVVAHTDLTQNADIIGNPIFILNKKDYEKLVISMDLVKVVPKNELYNKFYIFETLNSEKFKNHALGYVSGTTVLHLDKKCINQYITVIPDNNIVKKFSKIIRINYEKISELIAENQILEQLRDILLPKLMNGEINLDNIEI